uniref:HDC05555 n=1 Tax=Drosophila melanogaster TaxID=7227 RepID=Q6IGS1_DROME|nr:TPA_inf: HDC05555 [Drosophila melanogaster]
MHKKNADNRGNRESKWNSTEGEQSSMQNPCAKQKKNPNKQNMVLIPTISPVGETGESAESALLKLNFGAANTICCCSWRARPQRHLPRKNLRGIEFSLFSEFPEHDTAGDSVTDEPKSRGPKCGIVMILAALTGHTVWRNLRFGDGVTTTQTITPPMTKESTKERTQCCHLFALCLGIGVAHGAKAFLGSELKVVFMRRGMVESVGSFPAQTQSAGGWQSSSAMLRNFCCPLKHRNANKHQSIFGLACAENPNK